MLILKDYTSRYNDAYDIKYGSTSINQVTSLDHSRRQLIKKIGIWGVGLSLPVGGMCWLNGEVSLEELNFSKLLNTLDVMKISQVASSGSWDVPKILAHVAQSIELSIEGYPEHRSDLFKSTVGLAAFKTFARAGVMRHSLNESIPGADVLPQDLMINASLARLELSIARFKAYRGQLQPHFAYGALSKTEYEVAHVLHFMNHMQEVSIITNSVS